MLARFLIFLALFFGIVYAGQTHKCENGYKPSSYIGKHRVPITCTPQQLDCPFSWKSGIPEGTETSAPMIHQKFLNCHEGFTSCGYVPIDPKSGAVLGQSGVTVGAGIDLGNKSREFFTSLSSRIVNQLEPYFGVKRDLAACAAIERPLNLTLSEANNLTDAATNDVIDEVSKRYDSDKGTNALAFASVPRGIRTAIVSIWYQFGNPSAYPKFWSFVTKNDWDNAIKELRNFYAKPNKQARGDLKRRNNEADIIEATLLECNRSLDVVFLIDESPSVKWTNFQKSLDFVKAMITAFPDDKLSGKDGTRFGLSTFSSWYTSHFYLSNYKTQSAYFAAISRVNYIGSGTYLGWALRNILTDQFTEERGLRPEVDGIPRVLIVLTDGESFDPVSIPAKNVRDENIVVYGIGIGSYDLAQLKEIASSDSHVYTLSAFSQLEKFISTLTSSACYEPRLASLNETIVTTVAKDTYLYFSYKVPKSSKLKVSVVDLDGSTLVYGSRSNPHPYKYDNDISFKHSWQKNKHMVISPRTEDTGSTAVDELAEIFISVTSDINTALFQIVGNECKICTEGTNEILRLFSSARVVIAEKFLIVCFAMLMMLFEIYHI